MQVRVRWLLPLQTLYPEDSIIHKGQQGNQWKVSNKLQASCNQEGVWIAKPLNQEPVRACWLLSKASLHTCCCQRQSFTSTLLPVQPACKQYTERGLPYLPRELHCKSCNMANCLGTAQQKQVNISLSMANADAACQESIKQNVCDEAELWDSFGSQRAGGRGMGSLTWQMG